MKIKYPLPDELKRRFVVTDPAARLEYCRRRANWLKIVETEHAATRKFNDFVERLLEQGKACYMLDPKRFPLAPGTPPATFVAFRIRVLTDTTSGQRYGTALDILQAVTEFQRDTGCAVEIEQTGLYDLAAGQLPGKIWSRVYRHANILMHDDGCPIEPSPADVADFCASWGNMISEGAITLLVNPCEDARALAKFRAWFGAQYSPTTVEEKLVEIAAEHVRSFRHANQVKAMQ